ncbi:MAG: cysteine desulfurase [Ruminococcus sp.]|nr:cysteine desulfurase [Ruminococcus sp.]
MIYLDNAATTKPCEAAVAAVTEMMTENFGNPSSLHRAGLDAQLAVDKARKIIAGALNADSSNIIFTSGATESNNLAIRGACAAYGRNKRKIVASSVEHASVDETLTAMEKSGFEIVRVSPREDGKFYPADFLSACDENTVLLTMMQVNNETGHILPVKETFTAIKRRFPDIITHSDCVQAFMKLNISAKALNADLISISGHKVHSAKGVGALYIKKGIRVLPIVTGGKQEKGIRSGTESVPLICGFGAAVEHLQPTIAERYAHAQMLKDTLIGEISAIEGVTVNSPEDGSPYVINISAAGKRSEIMLHYLESFGIYVSSGSACSKGQQSGVLGQFGIHGKSADSALRVSVCGDTTIEDIRSFAEKLREGINSVRG